MSRRLLPLLAAAMLVACCASGVASRWDREMEDRAFRWLSRARQAIKQPALQEEEQQGAYVAIKYEVPPSMKEDFLEQWKTLEQATQQEEGLVMYDLKKTWNDNQYWWTYGEWNSMQDYINHFQAEHTVNFLDFLEDNDIVWDLYPLKNMTDTNMERRASRQGGGSVSKRGKRHEDDPRDMDAHVLIEYHVPPSKAHEFVDVFMKTAEKTWGEEQNAVYALRRLATANHHFIGYGTWDSYDAYMDHFLTKHVRKLREYLADSEIQWFIEPLVKCGEEQEDEGGGDEGDDDTGKGW